MVVAIFKTPLFRLGTCLVIYKPAALIYSVSDPPIKSSESIKGDGEGGYITAKSP